MRNYKMHLVFTILILFTGSQLGAQNDGRYKKGEKILKDRNDYCRFIESSFSSEQANPNLEESWVLNSEEIDISSQREFQKIESLDRILAPYFHKRIKFHTLPSEFNRLITSKLIALKQQRQKIQNQNASLKTILAEEQPSEDKRSYSSWKHEFQLPLQIKVLEDSLRKLDYEISRLSSRSFSGAHLFELALELEAEEQIPTLAIFVRPKTSTFQSEYEFYPSWKIQGEWTVASAEPWLSVRASFLPAMSLSLLDTDSPPANFQRYIETVEPLLPDHRKPKLQFIAKSETEFLIIGDETTGFFPTEKSLPLTTINDLGLKAFLDLACIQPPDSSIASK